jgi:tetratricopeptide (TPR) repeat protein
MRAHVALIPTLVITLAIGALAQPGTERQRARPHYMMGWQYMRAEAFEEAASAFRRAIDIDNEFEDAYYGLGRAQMAQKRFVEATAAYQKCRDLYRTHAGRQFSNQQDAQRYKRDRMDEIDQVLREYQQGPVSTRAQERARQLMEQRRQLKESLDRGVNADIETSVPAFVSLALGSAYFRTGKLAEAEREYQAAVAVDPKAGEAHSNLAVVYMETGRIADAERAIAAAEKAGYKVNPQLKQDIKDRSKKGT